MLLTRRTLATLGWSTTALLSVGAGRAAAQPTVAGVCVQNSASNCTLLHFLISADINPLALTTFRVDFAPGSGWVFGGGPTGSFVAEDDFSFGVPYGGSTSITNAGMSLFIAFLSPPTFELTPFSSGYIEVATSGSGNTSFQFSADDPDANVISGTALLSDPNVVATPEPSAVLLLAFGLVGLAGTVRARRSPSSGSWPDRQRTNARSDVAGVAVPADSAAASIHSGRRSAPRESSARSAS